MAFIRLRRYKEISVAELYARAGQVLLLPGTVMREYDRTQSSNDAATETVKTNKRAKKSLGNHDESPKTAIVKSLRCTQSQGNNVLSYYRFCGYRRHD